MLCDDMWRQEAIAIRQWQLPMVVTRPYAVVDFTRDRDGEENFLVLGENWGTKASYEISAPTCYFEIRISLQF